MCCQASLIFTPLVLSAIYTYNWEAPFYLSAAVTGLGALVMLVLSCRKDRNELGKKRMVTEHVDVEMVTEHVDVEMESKNVDVEMQSKNAKSENAATPTIVAPSAANASEEVHDTMELSVQTA